jgi:hypothetical protein
LYRRSLARSPDGFPAAREALGSLGWSVGVIGNSSTVVSWSDGAIARRRGWPDDRFSMAFQNKETRTSQLEASG